MRRGPNKRRLAKNEKYGQGGRKRGRKDNSAESTNDMSGFKLTKNKAPFNVRARVYVFVCVCVCVCVCVYVSRFPAHSRSSLAERAKAVRAASPARARRSPRSGQARTAASRCARASEREADLFL